MPTTILLNLGYHYTRMRAHIALQHKPENKLEQLHGQLIKQACHSAWRRWQQDQRKDAHFAMQNILAHDLEPQREGLEVVFATLDIIAQAQNPNVGVSDELAVQPRALLQYFLQLCMIQTNAVPRTLLSNLVPVESVIAAHR